ncbi:MAG TPA: hypothetical protein VFQ26_00505 [Nitrospiraceae bacterium]|nr:hypothetical protein [Nitrospiraceae bacterium]
MKVSTRVAPPNSLILVEDSSGGDASTSMNRSLIAATDSCIAVGCRAEDDGETKISLGYCSSVDTGDQLAFEGLLQTPSRTVVVRTTHNVTLLEMPVAATETTLRIWVNDPKEPDRITVGTLSLSGLAFQELKTQYFDVLCQRLRLDQMSLEIDMGYAIAGASDGNVRVYFEYERGLSIFSVGPAVDMKPMCSVETLAARFPRVRILAEGAQRLSLEEQAALLEKHWAALQDMYSAANLPAARTWMSEVCAAEIKKYSGGK